MRSYLLLVFCVACSGGEERRFAPLAVGGSGGDDGAGGTGSTTQQLDAGQDRNATPDSQPSVDAHREADAVAIDAADSSPIDRCPPGSIRGYPSVTELRARDIRECYAQVDGGWASWPEDGGFPDEVCCRTARVAWAGDVGCGERGLLMKEPVGGGFCDQGGWVLGGAVEAVRCCE